MIDLHRDGSTHPLLAKSWISRDDREPRWESLRVVFAFCYALFSGVVFISATGILLTPCFIEYFTGFISNKRIFGDQIGPT